MPGEEHHEAVPAGYGVHQVHHYLVLVVRKVGLAVDRSEFELVGRHLVVPCLKGYAEPVSRYLEVAHERRHPRGNGTEIMVVELLVLGRIVPHKGASCNHQVGAGGIERLVHEEVLLLPAEIGDDLADRRVEEPADGDGGVAHGLQRLLQGSLVVQGLAVVRDEDRGDAERVVLDEHRRCGIPGRISPGLEGGTDASAGERRRVRLLLYQALAVEGLDDPALSVIVDKRVMLLRSTLRKGLEPVRHMGHMVLHSPFLHSSRDPVGSLAVEGHALVDALEQGLESPGVEILAHLPAVEDELPEVVGCLALWNFHGNGLLLEGLLHQI